MQEAAPLLESPLGAASCLLQAVKVGDILLADPTNRHSWDRSSACPGPIERLSRAVNQSIDRSKTDVGWLACWCPDVDPARPFFCGRCGPAGPAVATRFSR